MKIGRDGLPLGVFSDHRVSALLFGIAGISVLPYAVLHFLQGDDYYFLVVAAISASLFAATAYTLLRRDAGYSGHIGSLIAGVGILGALYHGVGAATYWCFPFSLICYYVFPLRSAIAINGLFIVAYLAFGAPNALPIDYATRFLTTLALLNIVAIVFSVPAGRRHRRLEHLSNVDYLTGAGNRRAMEAAIDRAVALRSRGGEPVSMLVLDVDHFKPINDRHGHLVGDRILIELAALIRDRLRRTDELFRYGGEEFIVLMPATGVDGARRIAEALRERVAASDTQGVRGVTVSIGVAELQPGESATGWITRADEAMYAAKRRGRNRTEVAAET